MSYNIPSEGFANPLLKELLEKLTTYFTSIGSEFYIIGATARDIILSGIYGQQPGRMTDDLDIAIAIADWQKYDEIASGLESLQGFQKSKQQKQRFWFHNVFMLDIVPFGEIAKADNTIFWPPDETHAMSVAGFTDVAKHCLQIVLDNSFTIYVASLPGIFLLKLSAWRDRHTQTNKDADDMAFIITNYLHINMERAATHHYGLFEAEGFSTFIAGASLLGRDMNEILRANPAILHEFVGILQTEVDKHDESILLNQIMETHHSLKYEDVYISLLSLTNELSK
jgi:predicted nucleotidyltransferase